MTTDCIDALGSLEFPAATPRLEEIIADATRSEHDRDVARAALERFRRIEALGGLVRAWQTHD
jgi:hypothetical protein